MAVYTTLSELQVNEVLARFSLSSLATLRPASAGVENTTYFLTLADQRKLVLTLFESHSASELLPYLELLDFYSGRDLPVPAPLKDSAGCALQFVAGKPAVLVPHALGKHCDRPDPQQCRLLGTALAKLHDTSLEFPGVIPNPCGMTWAKNTLAQLGPFLDHQDCRLIQAQIAAAQTLQSMPLPRGIIHGDLFRDNVLFDSGQITALIDFYNAGHDLLLLDLAIAVNDWCFDSSGRPLVQQQNALRGAYEMLRPPGDAEREAWHMALCWAATRFWLSRLKAHYLSAPQAGHPPGKDPMEYRSRLLFHLEAAPK